MNRSGAPDPIEVARLFAEQRENVRNQLARIVPASEVDDVLQEVFVKAARGLPEFRGEAGVKTWLHRITQRAAFDHLRSRRHHEQQRTVAFTCERNDEACSPDRRCAGAATPAAAPIMSSVNVVRAIASRTTSESARTFTSGRFGSIDQISRRIAGNAVIASPAVRIVSAREFSAMTESGWPGNGSAKSSACSARCRTTPSPRGSCARMSW